MDRGELQRHLAQTERHIARGLIHIARQRALIAELDLAGHDAEEARAILDSLMETQVLHRQDRQRLLDLASQRRDRATIDESTTEQIASIREEDAQRWTSFREMEKRAIELLRQPPPDTFLGR